MGELLGEVLRSLLGFYGTVIIGFAILGTAVILRTPWTLEEAAQAFVRLGHAAWAKVQGVFVALREAWAEARELHEEEIRVSQPRTIESHPTVHHGVAEITGVLRPELGIADLVLAIVKAKILAAVSAAAGGGGAGALGGGPTAIVSSVFAKGGIVGAAQGALIRGGEPGRDSVLIGAQRGEAVLPKDLTMFLRQAAGRSMRESSRFDRPERVSQAPTVIVVQGNRVPLPENVSVASSASSIARLSAASTRKRIGVTVGRISVPSSAARAAPAPRAPAPAPPARRCAGSPPGA